MIVGVPREIYPEERRVAMVPAAIPALVKAGCEVMIEKGAGVLAGFPDSAYVEKGAKIVEARAEIFGPPARLADRARSWAGARRRVLRPPGGAALSRHQLDPRAGADGLPAGAGRLSRCLWPCAAASQTGLCRIHAGLWRGRPQGRRARCHRPSRPTLRPAQARAGPQTFRP